VWLSDPQWPATPFDHAGIHPLLVSPSLGRVRKLLEAAGRDPLTGDTTSEDTLRMRRAVFGAPPKEECRLSDDLEE
jgi:hypothetical protein